MKDQDDREKKSKTQPRLRVTLRDQEAIKFLLDQKFASRDQLYRAVWKTEHSRSSKYVWDRLKLLQIYGLIRSVRVHTRGALYYLATRQGALALEASRPSEMALLPLKKIHYQEFEHDDRVTECRLALESQGLASEWKSERRLVTEIFNRTSNNQKWMRHMSRGRLPDAIFRFYNKDNRALELELTPKAKHRYRKKVQEYALDIEMKRCDFTGVLFVTCTDRIFRALWAAAVDYPKNYFRVVPYELILRGGEEEKNESFRPLASSMVPTGPQGGG